jgi:hypothetical protein
LPLLAILESIRGYNPQQPFTIKQKPFQVLIDSKTGGCQPLVLESMLFSAVSVSASCNFVHGFASVYPSWVTIF